MPAAAHAKAATSPAAITLRFNVVSSPPSPPSRGLNSTTFRLNFTISVGYAGWAQLRSSGGKVEWAKRLARSGHDRELIDPRPYT